MITIACGWDRRLKKAILTSPVFEMPPYRTAMRFFQGILLLFVIGPASIAQGATEEELTVKDERLLPCPTSPNCVSTMAAEESHAIAPFRYRKPLYEAKAELIRVFSEFPRTTLVTEEEDYLHFEVRSFLFQFVDDVEFWLNEATKTIHFRSAARSGFYDFGVNRKRMEDLRGMLEGKL